MRSVIGEYFQVMGIPLRTGSTMSRLSVRARPDKCGQVRIRLESAVRIGDADAPLIDVAGVECKGAKLATKKEINNYAATARTRMSTMGDVTMGPR
jgi:hypothetical protein